VPTSPSRRLTSLDRGAVVFGGHDVASAGGGGRLACAPCPLSSSAGNPASSDATNSGPSHLKIPLTPRWRAPLDVRFYNCERLLWSCLDVAEGSEAVINDDHLHRVAPSVVENLSADVRTHAATPNGKRSESASVYRYADR